MPARRKTPPKLPGPMPIQLDGKYIEELAEIGMLYSEIAALCGVDESTIKHQWRRHWQRGRANRMVKLRRAQWDKAINGTGKEAATMLIWLGKNEMGQSDKQTIEQHTTVDDPQAAAMVAAILNDPNATAILDDLQRAHAQQSGGDGASPEPGQVAVGQPFASTEPESGGDGDEGRRAADCDDAAAPRQELDDKSMGPGMVA